MTELKQYDVIINGHFIAKVSAKNTDHAEGKIEGDMASRLPSFNITKIDLKETNEDE